MNDMDRRSRQRFPVSVKCLLHLCDSETIVAVTGNISRTGMLVVCDHAGRLGTASVGDSLQVDVLAGSDTSEVLLRCRCSVVWRAVDAGFILLGLAISRMSFANPEGEALLAATNCRGQEFLM